MPLVQRLQVDRGLVLGDDEEERSFLSFRNRFLVWPPGISPRSGCDSRDREHRRMLDGVGAMPSASRRARSS